MTALDVVLEAAERRSRELLNQASEYESKGFQKIADVTMDEHYYPLADAIAELRGKPVPTRRDRQIKRVLRTEPKHDGRRAR